MSGKQMDEKDFEELAAKTLECWAEIIEDAAEDFDIDCDGSVLTVELEDGRVFIINRHRPLKQLWLSSPLSGASHFNWDKEGQVWVATKSDARLHALLAEEISELAGTTVELE